MPLKPEDYGFHQSEIAPGEVELRWQPESWGPATWTMITLCSFGASIPILGTVPILIPVVPLVIWLVWRRYSRTRSLRLTRQHLVLEDGRWCWDDLSEISVENLSQLAGPKRGLTLVLSEEQAKNGFRVVVYRGPKAIVVAGNLGLRRAEYLLELLTEWARPDETSATLITA